MAAMLVATATLLVGMVSLDIPFHRKVSTLFLVTQDS